MSKATPAGQVRRSVCEMVLQCSHGRLQLVHIQVVLAKPTTLLPPILITSVLAILQCPHGRLQLVHLNLVLAKPTKLLLPKLIISILAIILFTSSNHKCSVLFIGLLILPAFISSSFYNLFGSLAPPLPVYQAFISPSAIPPVSSSFSFLPPSLSPLYLTCSLSQCSPSFISFFLSLSVYSLEPLPTMGPTSVLSLSLIASCRYDLSTFQALVYPDC